MTCTEQAFRLFSSACTIIVTPVPPAAIKLRMAGSMQLYLIDTRSHIHVSHSGITSCALPLVPHSPHFLHYITDGCDISSYLRATIEGASLAAHFARILSPTLSPFFHWIHSPFSPSHIEALCEWRSILLLRMLKVLRHFVPVLAPSP